MEVVKGCVEVLQFTAALRQTIMHKMICETPFP